MVSFPFFVIPRRRAAEKNIYTARQAIQTFDDIVSSIGTFAFKCVCRIQFGFSYLCAQFVQGSAQFAHFVMGNGMINADVLLHMVGDTADLAAVHAQQVHGIQRLILHLGSQNEAEIAKQLFQLLRKFFPAEVFMYLTFLPLSYISGILRRSLPLRP